MVRVRFAPSPTGYLHIGGARTALFNWLFARNKGGTFVLRIEDTDIERNRDEFTQAIIRDLRWLGLDWDEGPEKGGSFGPYFQSQRLDRYKKALDALKQKGLVYGCYCSPEELEERRKAAMAKHQVPGYDGRCGKLTDDERKKLEKEGRIPVLRFRVPDSGETKFLDLVRGYEVSFENRLLGDFVIFKSDGMPTFLFSNSVDDADMGITHVIRGDDHISNTPRQLLISRALQAADPVYAHVPLIFGKSGSPLSKRDGAVSVDWYRENGFLPQALVNYLVLLGWAPDGVRQVLTAEEMIKEFNGERVSKNPAIFDIEKLTWMNGEYLKNLDLDKKTDLVIDYLVSKGFVGQAFSKTRQGINGGSLAEKSSGRACSAEERSKIKEIVNIIGDRFKTIPDIETYGSFFFTDDIKYDDNELSLKLGNESVRKGLAALKEKFAAGSFDHQSIEQEVRGVSESLGLKAKELIHPLRYVLTGKTVGPSLFEAMALLGRDKVITRLSKVL